MSYDEATLIRSWTMASRALETLAHDEQRLVMLYLLITRALPHEDPPDVRKRKARDMVQRLLTLAERSYQDERRAIHRAELERERIGAGRP